ncbi:MAG: hypothetical protein ACFFA0_06600 [Promethearchaeota archaeon]
MPRFQKYEQKIRKYKEKLKKIVTRVGISYSEDFILIDKDLKDLILPCYMGILFYADFNTQLFDKIKSYLNQVFDSFFFEIRNLGQINFSKKFLSKGVKKEYKDMKKLNGRLSIHPTNKFYQSLIDIRKKNNLGMVIALTDLPIYSSSDDNIIFLFGETHIKHRCSIVSTTKLKEQFYERPKDNELFEQRVLKEIIHEIGHILMDFSHCVEVSCVMNFSKDIYEIDKKSYYLCELCKAKLDKIREKFNF